MKYQVGDRIGPNNLELLQITKVTSYGHRYGLFQCDCGNVFEAKIYHIASGATKQCKNCRKENFIGKNNINFKDLTGKSYGKIKVIKYIGPTKVGIESATGKVLTQSLWQCQCECGNYIERTTNVLERNIVHSCPECRVTSIGEEKIKKILTEHDIQYICQYKIPDCKDKAALPFDFYLPDFNILIEYDGLGHYKESQYNSSWRTKEQVQLTQKHDTIKTNYCKAHNIKLIRIPYYDYDKIDLEYLIK